MPDKTALFEWLAEAIDDLPLKGQIILNLEGDRVDWEAKAVHESKDSDGHRERTEIRKFGSLEIKGRTKARLTVPAKA